MANKQNWNIGDTVNVGFIKGLTVVEKVATPGDYRPDLYVLHQPNNDRWYSFVPHNGISRCASHAEAREF